MDQANVSYDVILTVCKDERRKQRGFGYTFQSRWWWRSYDLNTALWFVPRPSLLPPCLSYFTAQWKYMCVWEGPKVGQKWPHAPPIATIIGSHWLECLWGSDGLTTEGVTENAMFERPKYALLNLNQVSVQLNAHEWAQIRWGGLHYPNPRINEGCKVQIQLTNANHVSLQYNIHTPGKKKIRLGKISTYTPPAKVSPHMFI